MFFHYKIARMGYQALSGTHLITNMAGPIYVKVLEQILSQTFHQNLVQVLASISKHWVNCQIYISQPLRIRAKKTK